MPSPAAKYKFRSQPMTLTKILGELNITPATFYAYRKRAEVTTQQAIQDYSIGKVSIRSRPQLPVNTTLVKIGDEEDLTLAQACALLDISVQGLYGMKQRKKFETVQETIDYYVKKKGIK